MIVFENREAVSHNVSIYADDGLTDRRFEGVLFGGPATRWYPVPALEAGTYRLRLRPPSDDDGPARRCIGLVQQGVMRCRSAPPFVHHLVDPTHRPLDTGRDTGGTDGGQSVTPRRFASLLAAGLILLSLAAAGTVTAKGHLNVLLEDLSSPKGIVAGPKSVFVSQGWAGPPGPVLEWLRTGPDMGTARPTTDPINLVDIAATADGAGWAIAGDGVLFRQDPESGAIEAVLDILAYQAVDIDPDRHQRRLRPSRTRTASRRLA